MSQSHYVDTCDQLHVSSLFFFIPSWIRALFYFHLQEIPLIIRALQKCRFFESDPLWKFYNQTRLNSENSRNGDSNGIPRCRRLIVSIPKSLIRKLETANVISLGRDSKLGGTTRPEELEPYCLNYDVNNSKLRHYWAPQKLPKRTDFELFYIRCHYQEHCTGDAPLFNGI